MDNFFTAYWREILIVILCLIILSMITFFKSKRKKPISNIQINEVVHDIRKELRNEHKRITTLFKDLDQFVKQLPDFLAVKKNDINNITDLNMKGGYENENE